MASGQPTVPLTMGLGSQAAGHREAIPPTGGSEPRRGHEAQTQGQYLNRGGNQAQSRQEPRRDLPKENPGLRSEAVHVAGRAWICLRN